jgi:hypothetical protein
VLVKREWAMSEQEAVAQGAIVLDLLVVSVGVCACFSS